MLTLFHVPTPPLSLGQKTCGLLGHENSPHRPTQTGSENRVARNSVSCFGSSRRRESRPLLGRSGDNLTLLQERVERLLHPAQQTQVVTDNLKEETKNQKDQGEPRH